MDMYNFWLLFLIGLSIFIFYRIVFKTEKEERQNFCFSYQVLSIHCPNEYTYLITYADQYNKSHTDKIIAGYSDSTQEHNVFMGGENTLIIKRDKGRLYKHLILTKEYY